MVHGQVSLTYDGTSPLTTNNIREGISALMKSHREIRWLYPNGSVGGIGDQGGCEKKQPVSAINGVTDAAG
jgi:hypothetical protein